MAGCRRAEGQAPNVRPPSAYDHPVLDQQRISEDESPS